METTFNGPPELARSLGAVLGRWARSRWQELLARRGLDEPLVWPPEARHAHDELETPPELEGQALEEALEHLASEPQEVSLESVVALSSHLDDPRVQERMIRLVQQAGPAA